MKPKNWLLHNRADRLKREAAELAAAQQEADRLKREAAELAAAKQEADRLEREAASTDGNRTITRAKQRIVELGPNALALSAASSTQIIGDQATSEVINFQDTTK